MTRQIPHNARRGASNSLYVMLIASVALLGILFFLLYRNSRRPSQTADVSVRQDKASRVSGPGGDGQLFVYCAAGMRYPMDEIVEQYKQEYGVSVQLQYGGSNTLLSQLEVSRTGDLYLAADDSYIRLARERGLIEEVIPLSRMKPVIAVRKGNPKKVQTADDLLRDDVKVALGDPGAAAIGKMTQRLLSASGHWAKLEKHTREQGVFKPTVNDVANDVKLGSVDAGIIWDSTVVQYSDLQAVSVPELDAGLATIEIAVVKTSKRPTAALRFARYVGARDKGLQIFRAKGFDTLDGDVWEEAPELTFFAGAVNRRALEPIIKEFEQREGVRINTVYNGCGVLTAQMRSIRQGQESGFPDMYMACDVYYLETVKDWFQDAVNVSDTDIVIVVQKGNPKNIRSLADLAQPGVRVAVGEPDQCTIGVLSRRLLQGEGLYDKILNGNVVMQTSSSALLVPNVTSKAADAVLAYRTDTRAERNRLEVIEIKSPLAKAVQPYSIARSSDFKYLGRRLFDKISRSRDKFELAGFNWRLADVPSFDGQSQGTGADARQDATTSKDAP